MSRYGNYWSNESLTKIMDTKEINKMLEKKDLSPEMRKVLEAKKKILANDKEVKKNDIL